MAQGIRVGAAYPDKRCVLPVAPGRYVSCFLKNAYSVCLQYAGSPMPPMLAILFTFIVALSVVPVEEQPLPHQPLRIGRMDENVQGNLVAAICVDQEQPAWTLVYGVLPQDAARPCARKDMKKIEAREFGELQRNLRAWLLHEVQPEADVVARVLALARQQPGMPVGLTWDGGMAITANDYTAAERRLAAYRADPQGYAAKHWSH